MLPATAYFPHIDLHSGLLKALLAFFRQISLLQPGFSVPSALTEQALLRGWIRIDGPFHNELEEKRARGLLRNYERLAELHYDSGFLAYIKHGLAGQTDEETGDELIRKIRQYGQQQARCDGDRLWGQLLLQMAQNLDVQRRGIREKLNHFRQCERAFQQEIERDQEDDGFVEGEMERPPSPEEDDFLIRQRVRAWGEMLLALRDRAHVPLLTDNRAAVSHLLEQAGKLQAAASQCVQVDFPLFSIKDLDEVDRIRRTMKGFLPYQTFCERLESLISTRLNTPRTADSLRDMKIRGRALSAYFQERVLEGLLERVTRAEPCLGGRWQLGTLRLLLFSGATMDQLLTLARPSSSKNHGLLLFHIDDRQTDSSIGSKY